VACVPCLGRITGLGPPVGRHASGLPTRGGSVRQDIVFELVEKVKFFAGLEAYRFAWSNDDFSTRSGVATDTGFARFDGEDAEATQFNAVAGDQGLLHAFEDSVNRSLCFRSGQAGALNNPLYKILLNHLGRRP
jgi:hypothetical protein